MSSIQQCFSIADLKKAAKKAIPSVMFDYIEGGAEDERTIARNKQSFLNYEFVPRVLRDVSRIDLSTQVQDVASRLPIVIAPTAMSRMFHYQGELAVARAAKSRGIPYSLSTLSTYSIEEVAAVSDIPGFFQIYVWKEAEMIDDFMQRCKNNGYQGLMLTVDMPTPGNRERDYRNGHGNPKQQKRKVALGALTKPRWLYRFLTSPSMRMANMVEHLPHGGDLAKTIESVNRQFDASVTWDRAKQMRDKWQGKFLIKGIQSLADAKKAVEIGATGIVISNHGGRQLDGAPPAMDILPEIRDAVGKDLEIIIDGGVRRGSDVIKAIALGATACLIGRPYLYGLAAAGEAGVDKALSIFETEMERVMMLIGCDSIAKLDESYIRRI
jgi:L-lactate dehydrogenase (cytochrome)